MSWSVAAVGMSDVVAEKLAADFKNINLNGPEAAVKDAAAALIASTLAGFQPPSPVKVLAAGSQKLFHSRDAPEAFVNEVKVDIDPLVGFLSRPKPEPK